jgi:hypothetical protein
MDSSPEISMQYKTIVLGDDFPVKTFHVPYQPKTDSIGWYEDYVVGKNREYVQYRKDILDKIEVENINQVHSPLSGTNIPKLSKKPSYNASQNINTRESVTHNSMKIRDVIFFLGGLEVIFILIVVFNVWG